MAHVRKPTLPVAKLGQCMTESLRAAYDLGRQINEMIVRMVDFAAHPSSMMQSRAQEARSELLTMIGDLDLQVEIPDLASKEMVSDFLRIEFRSKMMELGEALDAYHGPRISKVFQLTATMAGYRTVAMSKSIVPDSNLNRHSSGAGDPIVKSLLHQARDLEIPEGTMILFIKDPLTYWAHVAHIFLKDT